MIINIRGTSGSGKSHLARSVMALYEGPRVKFKREASPTGRARKQPLGYLLSRRGGGRQLFVPGHYETACGGCDTINGLDTIFDLVREADRAGHDVLFEGLIVCSDANRTIEMAQDGKSFYVIGLTTPIEQCVAGIQARRDERGDDRPLNPRNTEAKEKTNRSVLGRFAEQGMNVEWLDRAAAFARVRELLDV